MTQNKAEDSVLRYMQSSGATQKNNNNNGPNKPLQPIQMQHKEIEREDDLERLHIHADPSGPR